MDERWYKLIFHLSIPETIGVFAQWPVLLIARKASSKVWDEWILVASRIFLSQIRRPEFFQKEAESDHNRQKIVLKRLIENKAFL
jgi:hypothetical protein